MPAGLFLITSQRNPTTYYSALALTALLLLLNVNLGALRPTTASAAGCPNGKCCPGGVCPTASPVLGSLAWPAPLGNASETGYAIKQPPPPLAFPAGTDPVTPAASGIWPFSTGRMGGSFGPRLAAQAAPAAQPHPAVVRIVAQDRDGMSLGSGTLIYVTEKHGLVLTNWHVVRDAVGRVDVIFPDGFRSAGTVIKIDNTWDLAAVGIWRPNVEPVPLAMSAPLAGEPLTIAGYGSGTYRAATGRRGSHLVSPGPNQPPELLEIVGAEARQGDSGGPIFNQQGQMAGVLFGAASGQTIGSYCGRVGMFLADVTPVLDGQRTDGRQEMFVNHSAPPPAESAAALIPPPGTAAGEAWRSADAASRLAAAPSTMSGVRQEPAPPLAENVRDTGRAAAVPARHNELLDAGLADARGRLSAPARLQSPSWSGGSSQPLPLAAAGLTAGSNELRWEDFVGTTRGEQAKSLLAAFGAISILLLASKAMLAAK